MYGRKTLSKLLNNTREGSVLLTFIRNTKMFMVVLASLHDTDLGQKQWNGQ